MLISSNQTNHYSTGSDSIDSDATRTDELRAAPPSVSEAGHTRLPGESRDETGSDIDKTDGTAEGIRL